jgi:RHS repeat-associated protein
LIKQENAKGDEDTIYYDIAGRDSIWTREDGNTVYSYYTSGGGKGKLSQIQSPSSYKKYSYDNYGRIIRECDSISSSEFLVFEYGYDAYGRLSSAKYPSGLEISYLYNSEGFPGQIKYGSTVIWECEDMNAFGDITGYSMNDGDFTIDKSYDNDGFVTGIKTMYGANTKQWYLYEWDDTTGNLKNRKDNIRSITENFSYDIFDRLLWSVVTGQDTLKLTYDNIGNISSKSDVGEYSYNSTKVHAVEEISGDTSYIDIGELGISYNHFNKPVEIHTLEDSIVFLYSPVQNRLRTEHYNENDQLIKTKYYSGSYERTIINDTVRHYHYIWSPEGPVALVIQIDDDEPEIYYLCTDHLNSITGIMNSSGTMLEEYNYGPWGRRRDPSTWSRNNAEIPVFEIRGFTGHEHFDCFSIIHMNGRLFDPENARFLNADPIIEDIYNIQAFNRYTYCYNPLKYVDPSGYKKGWWKRLIKLFGFGSGGEDDDPENNNSNGGGGSNSGASGGGPIYDIGEVICTPSETSNYNYPTSNLSYSDYLALISLLNNAQSGGGNRKILFGASIDGTIAIPWIGYTGEYGNLGSGKNARNFGSHGKAYGLEASVGLNLIILIPKNGKFTVDDFAGKSTNFTGSYGWVSVSFESDGHYDYDFGNNYYVFMIGIGPGIGGSTSRQNTKVWTPYANPHRYDYYSGSKY